MKRIVLIISGLLGLILCQATPKEVRVIRKGTPEFTIVLSKDAKPADKTQWNNMLNFVMDHVIAGQPCYIHCAAGADRGIRHSV